MSRILTVALLGFGVGCAPPSNQMGDIDHQMLQGTWQIMTVTNLATGEVDSTANRRTVWTQYTGSHWTYVWMGGERVGSTPAEFAPLSPREKSAENRAKMWDAEGQWRFWGSGGTYWLDGNRMYYTNVISIEPWQVQLGGVEKVLYVNDTAYVYHTVPRGDEPVREFYHRRIDTMGRLSTEQQGNINPADLRGNWQVMTSKHTQTGEVENVAQHRTVWFHVTDTHWTYVWMKKGRGVVTAAEFAALSPREQARERYAKIWDESHQPVFWASAGTYRIEDGNFIVEPRVMSIEPWMVGVEGVEGIAQLNETTYIYRSEPSSDGGVREVSHRRID